ncbi:tripartite tricarboxylate transporter TctB family protein [Vibrio sp. WJH972]
MSLERLQTGILILGMIFFYFVIMPGQVDHIENARIVPTTVPTIAIWIIIVTAVFQFISNKATINFNPTLCLRTIACVAYVITSISIMGHFGFEFGAPLLALGVMLLIGERRLHWLFLGAFVIPIGVWLLVEQVLNRYLP